MRLVVAHAVPRRLYITAKVIGSILGLGVPLLITLLLGLLAILLLGVPMSGATLLRIGILMVASGLLFTFLWSLRCWSQSAPDMLRVPFWLDLPPGY